MSAEKQPTVEQLYRNLQSQETSDQATVQLLKIAQSDERARQFMALHLPTLIEEDPTPTRAQYSEGLTSRPVWRNAVQLAGELKIVEAVPALAKWLTFSTSPVVGLGIGEEALVDSPAGIALANIGDPSIPALQPLLSGRDSSERNHAAYVLLAIDSHKAEALLRDYMAHGQDRGLADLIGNRLEMRATNKTHR